MEPLDSKDLIGFTASCASDHRGADRVTIAVGIARHRAFRSKVFLTMSDSAPTSHGAALTPAEARELASKLVTLAERLETGR